jgi:hypothetical protein
MAYPPLDTLHCRFTGIRKTEVLIGCLFAILFLLYPLSDLYGQEYTVHAADEESGIPLEGIPITLGYACTMPGSEMSG